MISFFAYELLKIICNLHFEVNVNDDVKEPVQKTS